MGGQNYADNLHRSVFTSPPLCRSLREFGFDSIRQWDPENRDHHNFGDFASAAVVKSGKAYPVSLNIETVKLN